MVAAGPQMFEQMTIAGRPCQFPFFYKGQVRNACVPYSTADSSAFCMDVDGHFAMCSPNPVSAYSTFQSWLDQWAGKGALQTAVSPHAAQLAPCIVPSSRTDRLLHSHRQPLWPKSCLSPLHTSTLAGLVWLPSGPAGPGEHPIMRSVASHGRLERHAAASCRITTHLG